MYRKFLNFSLEGKSLHCGTLTCSTLPLLDQAWVCQSFVSLAIRIWKRSPRHIECIEKVQQMCLSKLSIHVKAIFFSPAFQHVLLVLWVICRSIATSPDVAHNSWIHRYAYPRKREFAQTFQLPSQTGNYICRCCKSSWWWVGFDTLAAQPQVNLWQRPTIQRLQVRSRSYLSRFYGFPKNCSALNNIHYRGIWWCRLKFCNCACAGKSSHLSPGCSLIYWFKHLYSSSINCVCHQWILVPRCVPRACSG